MLSRLSRVGLHALNRARAGQSSIISRSHEAETISSYMASVGRNFFCSSSNTKAVDKNEHEAKSFGKVLFVHWKLIDTSKMLTLNLLCRISVTFIDKDGEEKLVTVPIGMSMLEAAHENDIELEGACEGSLACSTCHVIVTDVDYYNKLEDPADEENDMLDLAFGLTETSRLGCQVIASPELDGIRLALPAATRNFAVDGYAAKSH
ncbi:hypothetical protein EJB05_43177 [Eragrostis curvula]|uniref:2Fe-2S ferredoxin-type domain-containing protein n=1 Tax=Eragrostis curvula TaxID=38414 RepID=A0A5J9TE69_9POAL|nr:hypothetical protein EJB05_43177 [Eragrostis curvula]